MLTFPSRYRHLQSPYPEPWWLGVGGTATVKFLPLVGLVDRQRPRGREWPRSLPGEEKNSGPLGPWLQRSSQNIFPKTVLPGDPAGALGSRLCLQFMARSVLFGSGWLPANHELLVPHLPSPAPRSFREPLPPPFSRSPRSTIITCTTPQAQGGALYVGALLPPPPTQRPGRAAGAHSKEEAEAEICQWLRKAPACLHPSHEHLEPSSGNIQGWRAKASRQTGSPRGHPSPLLQLCQSPAPEPFPGLLQKALQTVTAGSVIVQTTV